MSPLMRSIRMKISDKWDKLRRGLGWKEGLRRVVRKKVEIGGSQ